IYADALFAGTLWLTNEMNIESADGYLNMTGSNFIMRSKTNTNNAVEITPNGITIHGFDGREFIVDGIMKGAQVDSIQRFNLDNFVPNNGRDMILTLEDYHRIYVLWDEYKGRFLDLSGTVRLSDDSAYTYRWVNVRIVEL